MKDPKWKTLLCYGSVIIFLLLPLILILLYLFDIARKDDIEVAKSFNGWFIALAGVVSSLAGLNTWANIKNGSHKN